MWNFFQANFSAEKALLLSWCKSSMWATWEDGFSHQKEIVWWKSMWAFAKQKTFEFCSRPHVDKHSLALIGFYVHKHLARCGKSAGKVLPSTRDLLANWLDVITANSIKKTRNFIAKKLWLEMIFADEISCEPSERAFSGALMTRKAILQTENWMLIWDERRKSFAQESRGGSNKCFDGLTSIVNLIGFLAASH